MTLNTLFKVGDRVRSQCFLEGDDFRYGEVEEIIQSSVSVRFDKGTERESIVVCGLSDLQLIGRRIDGT